MKISYCLIILVVVFLFSCDLNSGKDDGIKDYPFYDIHLKINPNNKQIDVVGKLILKKQSLDKLFFYLQRDLNINYFTINENDAFVKDTSKSDNRFLPQAAKMKLKSEYYKLKSDIVEIDFSYGGKLSDLPEYFANVISPEWTEMGLYYPWFPYNDGLKPFTYRLSVETVAGYKVFGLGKIERDNDKWLVSNTMPTNDIVVCMSKDVMKNESAIGQNTLSIFYHSFGDSLVSQLSADISNIVELYNFWFGENNQNISVIESKRKKGGGYARIGGVFLGGFKPEMYNLHKEGYCRYFAHELGHLWWYRAKTNSWEDWLNESFAEYSALMIIRELFGENEFMKRLDKKRENLDGTTPVWMFDRNKSGGEKQNKDIEEILYNKGPVLLYELEKEIGKDRYIELCKNIYKNNINTTAAFLRLLKSTEGEKVALWFEDLLKTR